MTTHTDEPQDGMTESDLRSWAGVAGAYIKSLRAELTAARTRIAEVEAAMKVQANRIRDLVSAHEASQRLRIAQTERVAELEGELERAREEKVRLWNRAYSGLKDRLRAALKRAGALRSQRDAAAATAEALRWMLQKHQYKLSPEGWTCIECGHVKTHDGEHFKPCALAAALATTDTDSTGGETT